MSKLIRCSETNKVHTQSIKFNYSPTYPPIQWVLRALSPVIKLPRHDVDYLPPSNAKVKNEWGLHLYFSYMPSWHAQQQLYLQPYSEDEVAPAYAMKAQTAVEV
jgi:hypothetical protein